MGFRPSVRLEFRGAQLSLDGVVLLMRELDDAHRLSDLAATALHNTRRGQNTVHRLDGLFRQLVFGRRVVIDGCQRCRACCARLVDAPNTGWLGYRCASGLGFPDGVFRDRYTGPARERGGSGRSEPTMDRPVP